MSSSEILLNLDSALDADPDNPQILHERGICLLNLGRMNEALVCLDLAQLIEPTAVPPYVSRAACLINMARHQEAIVDCTKALELDPNCVDALLNRGAAYISLKNPELALIDLERSFPLREDVRGLVNWCAAMHLLGRHHDALEGYRRALEMDPTLHVARSSLIACLDFIAEDGFEVFQDERKAYYEQHGKGIPPLDLLVDKDPDRPLTIGYVGADFKYHSAAFCFKPIIERRDRNNFKVAIYSGVTAPDGMTNWFQSIADIWHNTMGMTDDQLAKQIRDDKVDILVDLSGHSVGNKLMAFAQKPAPIQITAWGHGGGTGLKQVDYMFTDPVWIPAEARRLFAEKCWDLPCFITFEAPSGGPTPKPQPALTNGYITFGCMNRYQKVTPKVEELWVQVLKAVPDSRLLLKDGTFDKEEEQNRVQQRFSDLGVAPNRIEFKGGTSHWEHLNSYGDVDILLDSFPMGGGITTWEALWMGVPTITKLGTTQSSRIAGAIMCAMNLSSFVCIGEDSYIDLAVRMSKDYDYLRRLREQLRPRVLNSKAGSPERYTREVEKAYRGMWKEWCSKP